MTRVRVHSGVCGFVTTVTAEKTGKRNVSVKLDSGCEMVREMADDISSLDTMAAFTHFLQNPVYRLASRCLKHVACPVPSGILKALEVEAGLCLPRDAAIVFIGEDDEEP
jgi:hypothetical protein